MARLLARFDHARPFRKLMPHAVDLDVKQGNGVVRHDESGNQEARSLEAYVFTFSVGIVFTSDALHAQSRSGKVEYQRIIQASGFQIRAHDGVVDILPTR